MTTVDELAAQVAALTDALVAAGLAVPPAAAPLAAGDMPPHVAAGELITSAWGNAVVDALAYERGQKWNQFSHPGTQGSVGGWYDLGQTNLGPYTWDCRMTVLVTCVAGGNAQTSGVQFDLLRTRDMAEVLLTGNMWVQQNYYAYASMMAVWDVPEGSLAGFKTRGNITALTPGSTSLQMSSGGVYFMQRLTD